MVISKIMTKPYFLISHAGVKNRMAHYRTKLYFDEQRNLAVKRRDENDKPAN
jgi:hypothetical protein